MDPVEAYCGPGVTSPFPFRLDALLAAFSAHAGEAEATLPQLLDALSEEAARSGR